MSRADTKKLPYVTKDAFNCFRDNDIIISLQSGFVPGDSTVNQLIDIYNTFCKAIDEARKFEPYFVMFAKPSIECDTRVFFINSKELA